MEPANWTIALERGVTMTESNGEVLFFDEAHEQIYGVDGPAAEALVLLERGKGLREALGALLEIYEVDPDVMRSDVAAVLDTLVGHRLLRLLAATPA
jgi:hypothetical protein